jgi:hypothetical protein
MTEFAMRLTFLLPFILCATPLVAQTEAEPEVLPTVSHGLAMTCLALWASDIEANSAGIDPAAKAKEMVFFARLIAQTATPEEAALFDSLFDEEMAYYRSLQAELNNPATRDEADMDLTGTGKMCWFQVLAAEGGPYEGQ